MADIVSLFDGHAGMVKISAPMVRYSKLPFRMLLRRYSCDLVYSPMIMADSFIASQRARDIEFTTCAEDHPLVVQFGARSAHDFATAAMLIEPYADAVDINCGCPQQWAMQGGYGANLLTKPELICDMVRQARNRCHLPISIKIRIDHDLKRTVQLAQNAEHAGVAWITVHGRTTKQRSTTPPNWDAIKLVKENVGVPVVANGNVFTLEDAKAMQAFTKVNGVMAARGLLENPALFSQESPSTTPASCISDFLAIALNFGMPMNTFTYHLGKMTENTLGVADRRLLHSLKSSAAILDFFRENFDIYPSI